MIKPTKREVFEAIANGVASDIALVQVVHQELKQGKKSTDYSVHDGRRILASELEQYGLDILDTLE